MTDKQIRRAVEASIDALKAEEPPLKFAKVHERTTAQRLAVHIGHRFEGWNVDTEYDRDGEAKKKILPKVKRSRFIEKTGSIYPDVIVHHRLQLGRANNLLIIELKKSSAEDAWDLYKLEALTNPDGHYAYQLGLYINVNGGAFDCTWYKDGARHN
jgi:hypothetical protein